MNPPMRGESRKMGVIGEINNSDQSRIGVFFAGNLTYGTPPQFVPDVQLTLWQDESRVSNFVPEKNLYYGTPQGVRLRAGEKYQFRLVQGDLSYQQDIMLPDSFLLSGSLHADTVSLCIQPYGNSSYYYTVETYTAVGDELRPQALISFDTQSDNLVYREVPLNVNKLFLRNQSGRVSSTFRVPDLFPGDKLWLVVRSVPLTYYQYLYDSAIQRDENQYQPVLSYKLNDKILGIVGVAFVRTLSFEY